MNTPAYRRALGCSANSIICRNPRQIDHLSGSINMMSDGIQTELLWESTSRKAIRFPIHWVQRFKFGMQIEISNWAINSCNQFPCWTSFTWIFPLREPFYPKARWKTDFSRKPSEHRDLWKQETHVECLTVLKKKIESFRKNSDHPWSTKSRYRYPSYSRPISIEKKCSIATDTFQIFQFRINHISSWPWARNLELSERFQHGFLILTGFGNQ